MALLRNFALWLILFVTLWRFQESFYFFIPFRLGILSSILGAAVVLATNANDLFIILRETPLKKYFIIILVLGFFSIPFSVFPGNAIDSYTQYLRSILTTSIVIALSKNNRGSLQLCITVVLILLASQMLLQSVGGRISVSLTYDPNDIALLFVVFLPVAINGISNSNFIIKMTSLVASGLAVGSIALTGSRGGLIALFAVAIYGIILAKKRLFTLIILSGIGAAIFMAMAGEELWIRLQSLFDGTDYNLETSGDSRVAIWLNAVEVMLRRPILGVGFGQFVTGLATITDTPWKTAHNSFLEIGVELGLGGLYAFCAILFSLYKLSKTAEHADFLPAKEKNLYIYIRMSLLGFCVGGFFVSHAYSSISYTLFALGFVMMMDYDKKEAIAEYEQSLEEDDDDILSEDNEDYKAKQEKEKKAKLKAEEEKYFAQNIYTQNNRTSVVNTSKSVTKDANDITAQSKRALRQAKLEAGDMLRKK